MGKRASRVLVLTALLTVGVGSFAFTKYNDVYFLIKKNFTIFSEVYREVSLRYVDEVDPAKLMQKGIDAMLNALDPYTILIDESQTERFDIITTGTYGGVGIEVGYKRGKMVVIAPIEGYSAYEKGIKAGDIILSVNNMDLTPLSANEVQNIMYGEPGTSVNLKIKRFGYDEPLEFKLQRQRIEVQNITYSGFVGPNENIGYIVLNRFSQNTADEIRGALLDFKKNNNLQGLILDLRNNPGGLLGEAVKTIDKFVKPGIELVKTKGRIAENSSVYKSSETALLPELPVVVLQNSGSASASEVVAGSLQDLDRAVIIGEPSFGKGLVQIIKPLSYNTALKMTVSKYYIPSGRSIQSRTYTHDEYNSVLMQPDSSKLFYTTRNGRKVFGGEGIIPDIKVSDEQYGPVQMELMQHSHYFFFANQYITKIDTSDFPGQTKIMKAFADYLESQDFEFETDMESLFKRLETKLVSHRLTEKQISGINSLEKIVEKEKNEMLEEQEQDIYNHIKAELLKRLYSKEKQMQFSTGTDKYLFKAIELIQDSTRYHTILLP